MRGRAFSEKAAKGRSSILASMALLAVGLSACNSTSSAPPAVSAPIAQASIAATPDYGAVIGPDGRCTGAPSMTASAIAPGIGECDLLALKGKIPTDVLVGESGKGQREVQVLYSEPGGRELYFFVNNKLDRIVK
ncbi:hypothetical protein [Microvirga alba]|uniref:Lipoprotein n=1 Tax=Microvirga alba TaxID=2791025 RepID=A0A931BR83_9HYPH|nr:hypothetical protein [Microvirga alba]MBF9232270.1 hypothetical protein [Microvirga alba]